jgi:hypothetical protein
VGAKQTSKGLVQRFGVECCVKCKGLVLCGAKQTSKGLVLGVGCYARIRCGFPVKKSISVKTTYRSGGLAVSISGCGAGAVPSKQAKQTSKGLVFDAVRVQWRCGCGAVLNKQARISKGLVLG